MAGRNPAKIGFVGGLFVSAFLLGALPGVLILFYFIALVPEGYLSTGFLLLGIYSLLLALPPCIGFLVGWIVRRVSNVIDSRGGDFCPTLEVK